MAARKKAPAAPGIGESFSDRLAREAAAAWQSLEDQVRLDVSVHAIFGDAAPPASPVKRRSSASLSSPKNLVKRRDLILQVLPRWPSVETDLNHADRELREANVRYATWDRAKAIAWANKHGKWKRLTRR